jgi:hypothetical protein
MALLYAFLKKGSEYIPGQIKFNSTWYPAPYGYSAFTCTIGEHVYVDGKPDDTSLSAPNDPRTVHVTTSVQYTFFYYS